MKEIRAVGIEEGGNRPPPKILEGQLALFQIRGGGRLRPLYYSPHPRFSNLPTALKEAIAAKAPFKWAKTSAGTAGHMLLFPASRRRFRRAAQLFNFLLRSSQPSKFTPVEMLHYD